MYAQQQSRALVDGFLVVGDAGAISGANLAQDRARLSHDVGYAERSADLDQLSARDDDLAAFSQSVQRQQDGGSIVVDHDGSDRDSFRRGGTSALARAYIRKQLAKQPVYVNVPLAAFAR